MKRNILKVTSAILVISLMLPLASCKKDNSKGESGKGRSGQKIEADTPWFDSRKLEFDAGLDPNKKIENINYSMIGCDDEKYIMLATGMYEQPVTDDHVNLNDYIIYVVSVVDRATGESLQRIRLLDNMSPYDSISSVQYSSGKLTVQYWVLKADSETEYDYYEKDFDILTGKVTDTRPFDPMESAYIHSLVIDGYQIKSKSFWDADASIGGYTLQITTPDGVSQDVSFPEVDSGLGFIYFFAKKNANTIVIPARNDAGDNFFFELDLKSLSISQADSKEYEWLDLTRCSNAFNGSDNFVYARTSDGFLKINFEKKTIEDFFNYSYCGINRDTLESLNFIDINGDTIMLAGEDSYHFSYDAAFESTNYVALELKKASKNPHAGKTILELYSATEYSSWSISDAILKFNDTNGKYFIEVSSRYDITDYSELIRAASNDDYYVANLNLNSKMSDKLAIDIMNGEGPDILLNVGAYDQLMNSNYLTDLTPFINMDSSKYFTNIIDISKKDGKLYNLPICYSIKGIQTSPENAGASGVGFTTAEYEKFLKGTLNGEDIISYGQAYYFAELFNNMSDRFIANGKADFSGPEFAELAKFVNDNVRERSTSWSDYTTQVNGEVPPAFYTDCFGVGGYLPTLGEYRGESAILGLPSADGRGPLISPYLSIAVSAQAVDVNACGEFVKILLSDEVQTTIAMSNSCVLNRDAFRKGAESALNYYNGPGYYIYFGDTPEKKISFTNQNIDDFEKIIMSCSGVYSSDGPITIILIEEMPAYFSGQKDLASVVKIAQDRAQKVLDERK